MVSTNVCTPDGTPDTRTYEYLPMHDIVDVTLTRIYKTVDKMVVT